jgi:hypothetical protein
VSDVGLSSWLQEISLNARISAFGAVFNELCKFFEASDHIDALSNDQLQALAAVDPFGNKIIDRSARRSSNIV